MKPADLAVVTKWPQSSGWRIAWPGAPEAPLHHQGQLLGSPPSAWRQLPQEKWGQTPAGPVLVPCHPAEPNGKPAPDTGPFVSCVRVRRSKTTLFPECPLLGARLVFLHQITTTIQVACHQFKIHALGRVSRSAPASPVSTKMKRQDTERLSNLLEVTQLATWA